MKYVEKSDNVERVYSVYYDELALLNLLNRIVRQASYRVNGTFTAPYGARYSGKKFTSGAELPNGDPMYENITSIYPYTSNDDQYSYRNDSIAVEGTKITSPHLADIIKGIIDGKSNSISEFLNYSKSEELISLDKKIFNINEVIDKTDNFCYDEKIEALELLKRYCENKNAGKFFDVTLLKRFYDEACSLIGLQLVSEKTIKNDVKILIRDYKPSENN